MTRFQLKAETEVAVPEGSVPLDTASPVAAALLRCFDWALRGCNEAASKATTDAEAKTSGKSDAEGTEGSATAAGAGAAAGGESKKDDASKPAASADKGGDVALAPLATHFQAAVLKTLRALLGSRPSVAAFVAQGVVNPDGGEAAAVKALTRLALQPSPLERPTTRSIVEERLCVVLCLFRAMCLVHCLNAPPPLVRPAPGVICAMPLRRYQILEFVTESNLTVRATAGTDASVSKADELAAFGFPLEFCVKALQETPNANTAVRLVGGRHRHVVSTYLTRSCPACAVSRWRGRSCGFWPTSRLWRRVKRSAATRRARRRPAPMLPALRSPTRCTTAWTWCRLVKPTRLCT